MSERTIALLLAYDGTDYQGWQRQQSGPTIQQTVEERLALITGRPVVLHGAGRTDSGVHAEAMTAHFLTSSPIAAESLVKALNAMLPKDIRILQAKEKDALFHSRYSALAKTYRYDFFTAAIQMPGRRRYEAHFPGSFNPEPVRACLRSLLGSHDFSSFEGSGSRDRERLQGRGAVRVLYKAECIQSMFIPCAWSFFFTGDGFLRHMVRNLAGTLLEVGRERLSIEDFFTIVSAVDRRRAKATAPAKGLHLCRVWYEELPSQPHPASLP